MRSMTAAFRRAIADGRVDYTNYLEFTFADNSTLSLDNENIMIGGCKMEDAVSDEGVFQVGAVIVGAATFTLNNMDNSLTDYPFEGAKVVWYVGMDDLDDDTDATVGNGAVKMGTFWVDETEYDGHILTLRCLDVASKLDVPYIRQNASLSNEVHAITDWLTNIGMQLDSDMPYKYISYDMMTIPHGTYYVGASAEDMKNVTCRQVASWVAQIAGVFLRSNADGKLTFGWYDTDSLSPSATGLYGGYFDETTQSTYQSGDTADGGSFNPWNTGYVVDGGSFTSYPNVNLIQSCFSQKLSLNDIEITGVQVTCKTGNGGDSASTETAMTGTGDYVISIEGNLFINKLLDSAFSRNTIQDILGFIGSAVIGMNFRPGEITHPSDPAIEAGDVAFYWDIHQNQHAILVSSTEFSCGVTQRTVSSAASASNNASTSYSNTTRNYTEIMSVITGSYIKNQLDSLSTGYVPKIATVYDSSASLSVGDNRVTFNLPSDFHTSFGVVLELAWPATTWTGAVVTICRDGTRESTPSGYVDLYAGAAQSYRITMSLIYI